MHVKLVRHNGKIVDLELGSGVSECGIVRYGGALFVFQPGLPLTYVESKLYHFGEQESEPDPIAELTVKLEIMTVERDVARKNLEKTIDTLTFLKNDGSFEAKKTLLEIGALRPSPTFIELCDLVANAVWRPFEKKDYDGWAGVSAEGPHLIADVKEEAVLIRDGDEITYNPTDQYMTDEGTIFLTMKR
jgi:hypothetical protein